jgi:hypothetical protein
MRVADGVPVATDGFDASEGILTSMEVAQLFSVDLKTVQRWARAAIAAQAAGKHPKVPVMRTPGGDWRFSGSWARMALERVGG